MLAFVNTRDDAYNDYGFIIYGAKKGEIKGATQTPSSSEMFQTHLENLIREYLAPFVTVYAYGFIENNLPWGVVVVPPSNRLPHTMFREFQYEDNGKQKVLKKGEWFVRKGSTTEPAGAEDYARILSDTIERAVTPQRDQLKLLQADYQRLEDRLANMQQQVQGLSLVKRLQTSDAQTPDEETIFDPVDIPLATRLRKMLGGQQSPLADELLSQALELRAFLESSSDELPWLLNTFETERLKAIIQRLEQKVKPLLESITVILSQDKKGSFDDAIIQVITLLARVYNPPSNTTFNEKLKELRDYPLLLLFYTLFVVGVQHGRASLLRRALNIPFKAGLDLRTREPIIRGIWRDSNELFNLAFHPNQKMCEPELERIETVLRETVFPLLPFVDEKETLYTGEFVLALAGIEYTRPSREEDYPLPGLYLYFYDADAVVKGFLAEPPEWFRTFYAYPIEEMLAGFDKNAKKMVSGLCSAHGLTNGTLETYKSKRIQQSR